MKITAVLRLSFPVCIIALIFCGCTSLIDKAGRAADGSAFSEKKTARYRAVKKEGAAADIEITEVQDKAGQRSVIIQLNDYPMMKLRGSYPDEKGEFYLTALEYLGGSAHGWNEYTMDMAGTGSLTLGETAVLTIDDEIEQVQISGGRIQRFDTRIVGSEALTNLRNRRERVAATVEWMASLNGPKGQSLENFDQYYKPLLFPEMAKRKHRPKGWLQEGDVRVKAEDIRWNTGYTDRVFPEELKNVRNSGTLFRDWEDALSWIYLEYEWENIKELLSRQIILQRIK
jgi:hypothetical protein